MGGKSYQSCQNREKVVPPILVVTTSALPLFTSVNEMMSLSRIYDIHGLEHGRTNEVISMSVLNKMFISPFLFLGQDMFSMHNDFG